MARVGHRDAAKSSCSSATAKSEFHAYPCPVEQLDATARITALHGAPGVTSCQAGGMRRFWTPKRDAILREGEAAGMSASEIAAALGTTRNAVIGRSHRLRGTIFPSQLSIAAAAREQSARTHAEKNARKAVVLARMIAFVAEGEPRGRAIVRALDEGVTLRDCGSALGVSYERCRRLAGDWKRRDGVRTQSA